MNKPHSPLPWCVCDKTHYPTVRDRDGVCIAKTDCSISSDNWVKDLTAGDANAEFIVRAVNNHDDLVVALERLIQAYPASSNPENCSPVWEDAKRAIAKATNGGAQ